MKFLLLACLLGYVIAATPLHPQWPTSFSTTAVFNVRGARRPEFSRWFYSQSQNIDRLDGLSEWEGELYFAERFFNHNTNREYNVFYQRDASVQCFTRAIQNPLPQPNFVNFTYVGQALIDYQPAYHWILRGRDGAFFQFFDAQNTRQPLRFDAEFPGRPAIQINYMEFDAAPQSSQIFQIPSQILAICNNVNNKGNVF